MPTDSSVFWSPNIELLINNVIWFVPWQTVHFFGYSLVFATVLAVTLRVLGFGNPFHSPPCTVCSRSESSACS